ncbi:hypothetical protein [Litorilituus sediminis]|uniref:Uncharacterized protein n=1 Tax=Litorilituus sediminis TaxID=718192 RepID=A0A4P6P313_9GAMM|nr:hypothetical protein [Litorilituus sediminis]QBG35594.1 hypothetical protein EMK97_07645 [Litorilituus sediminis]
MSNTSNKSDTVRSSILKQDSAHALVKALSSQSFDPSFVDKWYKEQRMATIRYARELVAK